MTSELLRLDEWLHELGVTVVAMESTGVFWHPICTMLEEGREIILVNAQQYLGRAWAQDGARGRANGWPIYCVTV